MVTVEEDDDDDEDDWLESLELKLVGARFDELAPLMLEAELLNLSVDGFVSLRRWPHVRLALSEVVVWKEEEKCIGVNRMFLWP